MHWKHQSLTASLEIRFAPIRASVRPSSLAFSIVSWSLKMEHSSTYLRNANHRLKGCPYLYIIIPCSPKSIIKYPNVAKSVDENHRFAHAQIGSSLEPWAKQEIQQKYHAIKVDEPPQLSSAEASHSIVHAYIHICFSLFLRFSETRTS